MVVEDLEVGWAGGADCVGSGDGGLREPPAEGWAGEEGAEGCWLHGGLAMKDCDLIGIGRNYHCEDKEWLMSS